MSIIFSVLLGLICGALVGALDKLRHAENLIGLTLSLVFGVAGTMATEQLMRLSPDIWGVDFLPALVGGLVVSGAATLVFRQCSRWYGERKRG